MLLCLIAFLIGVAFASQYFFVEWVSIQYTYLFYALTAYGLIYIFHYGYRWIFLKKRKKQALLDFKSSQKNYVSGEQEWMSKRAIEHKNSKFALEISVFIGVIAFIIGLAGFYKNVLGATGVGIMLGSGFWFCFELFSEFQCKEYEQFVERQG